MEPRNTGVEPRKTRKARKKKEGGRVGTTNGHEWTRMSNTRMEPRKRRKARKIKKGGGYEPRMDTNNRSRGKFPISAVPSFLLVPLTEKAVGFWVLPRGSTAFEMVCDAGLGPATSTVSG